MPRRQIAKKSRSPKKWQTNKAPIKAKTANQKAQWQAYQSLQKKINKAFLDLRANVRKKANIETINRSKNHLLLLLGECDYMARECMRMAKNGKTPKSSRSSW